MTNPTCSPTTSTPSTRAAGGTWPWPVRPSVTDEGPAWFTVGDDGPDRDQLAAGIEALGSTLTDLATRLAVGPGALVLGGYSQGGAMALAALLDPTLAGATDRSRRPGGLPPPP